MDTNCTLIRNGATGDYRADYTATDSDGTVYRGGEVLAPSSVGAYVDSLIGRGFDRLYRGRLIFVKVG